MVKMQLNVKEQEWVPAQVPGDIYMALLQAGKMEDPFWEDNEYQAKALMEEDYEYKTVFIYDETEFENCQEVILRFDGIDTIGDIYLNECCLGRVESMHRVWVSCEGDSGKRRKYSSCHYQISSEIYGGSLREI